jgi:hypothetical protein
MAMEDKPALWKCPECGHRFVTRNLWHSCSNYTLDHHFADKGPGIRALFNEFVAFVEPFGPFTIIPQKTRIAFQVRVRFAACTVRKDRLDVHLWLKRKAEHPLFNRYELIPPDNHLHYFRLTDPEQLDSTLAQIMRECCEVGRQEWTPAGTAASESE